MEKPPIELLEKIVTSMLEGEDIGACGWPSTLKRFRKALDAARRENAWDVVALAFGNIVALSFEMLVRSQLAMHLRIESLTERRGADLYPNIRDDAERVERVARFLLEAAEKFAKVRHVTHLARRKDDPKISYLDDAKGTVDTGKDGLEDTAPRAEGAGKS